MTEEEIDAVLKQSAAMTVIADGYTPSVEEDEISRKCMKGEISWDEGMKLIMNLPITGKRK